MSAYLNLLPPQKKRALRAGFLMAYAQTVLAFLTVVAAFVAGTLVAVSVVLGGDYDELQRQTSSTSDEYATIADDVKQKNNYLKKIDAFEQSFVPWSAVLESLTAAMPSGVTLEQIVIGKDYVVSLYGTAASREDVLAMERRLNALAFFSDVKAPLSNLLQQKNVKFNFEMRYNPPKTE